MALVGATAITAFANKVFEDALLVARDNNLMAGLVTNFNDRSGTAIRQLQVYGSATPAAIGDETDLSGAAFTPAAVGSISPTEIGAQFNVSDLRMETDPFNVQADAALELGMAMAQKIDTDLLNAGTTVTGGTISSISTAPTWGNFFALLARLRNQVAPFPYACVMHPYHWHALGKTIAPGATVTNSPELQNSVAGQFYVGSVGGVNIYTSANITSGTAAPIIMFSQAALALDVRRPPRIELQRDASLRSWELNLTAVYGAAAWRPKFGVFGQFDASTPSS